MSQISVPGQAWVARFGRLLAVVAAIGSVAIMGAMLRFSSFGIDFTDEGYYLVSIATPDLYPSSTTEFGFVYHPLFEMLGSDIVRLRQVNILLTFLLAWVLADLVLRRVMTADVMARWQRWCASSAIATASLLVFALWLLTPSYNSLGLQGLTLVAIGLLVTPAASLRAELVGGIVIGLGATAALLAKPTTGAAAAALVVVAVGLSRGHRLRRLFTAGGASIVFTVICAFAIDGSVGAFVSRLSDGARLLGLMGSAHTIADTLRIDPFRPGERLYGLALVVIVLMVVIWQAMRVRALVVRAGLVVLGLLAGLAGVWLMRGSAGLFLGITNQVRLMVLFAVPLGAAAVAMLTVGPRGLKKIGMPEWGLALVLLLLPLAYAIGSNVNYWRVAGAAAVFWVLAGLILLVPLREVSAAVPLVMVVGIATQALSVLLIGYGAQSPYRQPHPVQDFEASIRIEPGVTRLRVDRGFASYLQKALRGAEDAGFGRGTPVIDLSGKSPTLLYALGAKSLGQPWIIGGYPGSGALAVASLRLGSCKDLGAAWLLVEPTGQRKLPDSVLTAFGADVAKDYQIAAQWSTAPGTAGFAEPQKQLLLKPTRSTPEALDACRSAR